MNCQKHLVPSVSVAEDWPILPICPRVALRRRASPPGLG